MPISASPPPQSPEERQAAILARIEREGRVSATTLAAEFGVSEDSIRRDLRDLAEGGLIQRVHGGAIRRSTLPAAFGDRLVRRPVEKSALAAAALGLLRPGATVLLDQSTTTLALAHLLPAGADLTIVTATPEIALAALGRGVTEVIMLGGRLDPVSRAVAGPAVLAAIGQIHYDLCVLGACGIDIALGITAQDHDDACLKRAMVAASAAVTALITADKFDTASPFRVAPLSRLDRLVAEAHTPPDTLARYAAAGVDLLLA